MKKWIFLFLIILFGGFLRFYNISHNPPGLYIDEVSIGNNAYSILAKGQDQYGVNYPLFFKAYGEYKMPVYIYLTSVSMAIFGKNEFAIRAPSAFFGTFTLLPFFFLLYRLLSLLKLKESQKETLSLIGTLVLATSSWHLQFARAGFEAVVALFFFTSALCFYIWLLHNKSSSFYIIAYIFLGLTFYTYDGYRLIVPIAAILGFFHLYKIVNNKKVFFLTGFLFLISLFPLILFSLSKNGMARFSQTSAFYQYITQNVFAQILIDLVIFSKNLLSFFSFTYFFHFGDQINRHQVAGFGVLYFWQLPFLIFGVYFLMRQKDKLFRLFTLFLFLAAPTTAALTIPSPHTLRNLLSVIPFSIITTVGIYQLFTLLSKKKLIRKVILFSLVLIAGVQFVYYLNYYYIHYPKEALMDWGGSCKQLVNFVGKEGQSVKIYVDRKLMCGPDYFSFYGSKSNVFFVNNIDFQNIKNTSSALYIKPKNKDKVWGSLVNSIELNNQNRDVFAQIYRL